MKSEWRVREEYAFMKKPVYQVYRLKDKDSEDRIENREVAENVTTRVYAEELAKKRNDIDKAEHFWEK